VNYELPTAQVELVLNLEYGEKVSKAMPSEISLYDIPSILLLFCILI
jgi:hypothetical protein